MRRLLAIIAVAAALSASSAARADLAQDVQRLSREWRDYGRVGSLAPRMLERGDVRPLLIAPEYADPSNDRCTTVAVLGAPSANFVLRFLPGAGALSWPQGEWPEASVAGASQIVRCGARKAMLGRLAIEMRSPRAVFEVLVAEAAVPLPSLRRTLAHRDPGPSTPMSGGGPRPVSAPIDQRARTIDQRAKRQGAAEQHRRVLESEADGSGEALVRLERGCHRLDVLGVPSPPGATRGVDIDVELYWALGQQLAASDRTESADSSVQLCVGELSAARLQFVGSLPGAPVALLHSRWDLPGGLPAHWGPEASARIAEAVWQSHNRSLGDSPVYESLGVAGVTALPMEVEPGACYLVAAAVIRGEASGLAVAAAVGRQRGQNHGGPEGTGTVLAFCADAESLALLEVETRGVGVVWLLAVWQTGRVPIGEVQQ